MVMSVSVGTICSPSPVMVTCPYERKILFRDEKQYTNTNRKLIGMEPTTLPLVTYNTLEVV